MAYSNTLKLDQLFVRDIYFKDYGNTPIGVQQLLVTGRDGRIHFSNVPYTSTGIYNFNYVQIDSTFRYAATDPLNILYLASGQGIQLKNNGASGTNTLVIDSLAPQNIFIYDTSSNLSLSSLSSVYGAGRTLCFAGKDDINISLSANTIFFGGGYNSTLSTFADIMSTTTTLIENTSTQIVALGSLFSTLDMFLLLTNFSTIYQQLTTYSTTIYTVSSFLYSTFADDGHGNHTKLIVNSISTPTLNVQAGYASTFQIGSNLFYDSQLGNASTPDCIVYVADGAVSTYTDYLHIKDTFTTVDVAIEKRYLTSQNECNGSTFTTAGQIANLGFFTGLDGTSSFKPVTEQIEKIHYVVGPDNLKTTLSYSMQNAVYADDICAPSTITLMAPDGVNTDVLRWSSSFGNTASISSLSVSTIKGNTGPIFTFDKVNNRVGLNLGTTQPRATFDVSGVVYATCFVTSSDRRLKSDIRPLKDLDYLSSYHFEMDGVKEIGVLADEVERIAPSCVYERPDGYKAVNYPKLVPVLLSYIHDLDARLKKLEGV